MVLMNDIPNQQIISDKSPFKEDKSSNILMSLSNYDPIIGDKSPLKNNRLSKNISLPTDDTVSNDTSIQADPHNDDFEDDYLVQLKNESDTMLKMFDEKIDNFEKKIRKTADQLNRMNHDLKQMILQKENKQNEFIQLISKHKCFLKSKK